MNQDQDQNQGSGAAVTPRFHKGQWVRFSRGYPYRNAAEDDYEVLNQLPSRDGEFQYRIKSKSEPYERVVREGEIERI
jgi:hypothetical protein